MYKQPASPLSENVVIEQGIRIMGLPADSRLPHKGLKP
jgi:hypothetical protein